MKNEMKIGYSRSNIISQRWWLRSRKCEAVKYNDWTIGASSELYVPLWAWIFEIIHRSIFGKVSL